jgi:hypothetical protein
VSTDRLTPHRALPLNAAFRVRRPRDEVYGPFTGKELRLYLDLVDGTSADRVTLTEADATLSDSDYVIDFLMNAAWTGANLSEGTWRGRLTADEVYVGGFTFDAVEPDNGEIDP